MQGVTLIIAALGFFSSLVLKPVWALLVYAAVLFAYPEAMTVPIFGTIDFNAHRITVIGLLCNMLFINKGWWGLKWNWLDTFVVFSYICPVLSALRNVESSIVWERQFGGQMFDILFPYLSARMVFKSRQDILTFFKGLVYIGVPLAIFAAYESKTGHNIYSIFYSHYGWGLAWATDYKQERAGFYRASSSFGIPILLGLFFSALATITVGLWREKVWSHPKTAILFGIMFMGVMASVSSAPLFSIVISLVMIMAYPLRRYWPVMVLSLLACMIFVEVYSNRHFYHVLTWFSFSSKTAYYRIALLEEAFGGGMTGHWLFGYGYVGIGPGNDNTNFGWQHKDFTNLYIAILARFGLFGVIPFIIMQIMYYRKLYISAKSSRDKDDLWLIWCLTSALTGWNISMLTVAAFRQIAVFQFLLIALCNCMPLIIRATAEATEQTQATAPKPSFRRPPWRHRHARRFGGHRELERPGLSSQLPELPPEGYHQA